MYSVEYACLSCRGKIRSSNQDNFVCLHQTLSSASGDTVRLPGGIVSCEKPLLFGVFDGMGGEEMGEVASMTAANTARDWPLDQRALSLDALCREANRRIVEFSSVNALRSSGTTAAMLLFDKNGAVSMNIGDSRIYRLSGKSFTQLSTDHVLPVYRKKKPPLIQYLGIEDASTRLEPSVLEIEIRPDDVYLICSDGVTDMLSDDEIKRILMNMPASAAADALMEASMNAGGIDNITLIVLRIVKEDSRGFAVPAFIQKILSALHSDSKCAKQKGGSK